MLPNAPTDTRYDTSSEVAVAVTDEAGVTAEEAAGVEAAGVDTAGVEAAGVEVAGASADAAGVAPPSSPSGGSTAMLPASAGGVDAAESRSGVPAGAEGLVSEAALPGVAGTVDEEASPAAPAGWDASGVLALGEACDPEFALPAAAPLDCVVGVVARLP